MKPQHKEITLFGLLVFTGVLLWLSLSQFLQEPKWSFDSAAWSALIAGLILLILWSIAILAAERQGLAVLAWAIVSYLPLLWFLEPLMMAAASGVFIFGVLAYFRALREISHTLHGSQVRVLRKAVPFTVTLLAIQTAFAGYLVSPAASLEIEAFLPERVFQKVLEFLEPILQTSLPSFSAHGTFRDYILKEAGRQAKIDPYTLPRPEQDQVVNTAVAKFKEDYGIMLEPDDSLTHILYQAAVELMRRNLNSYGLFLPIAFSVGFFLIIRLIGLPLYWLAIAVSVFIMRLLLRFDVVKLRVVPTEIQTYAFK